ncbi:ECF transporter S component [[Clostridium] polysaccharolyticum]|uniref:ECF transporter S component n=1 Tax=[Clostridium] polysaccharolyticum TaxID=29364 RepID=A0A1I0CJW5_9FIRM|nr:ECF transporter S component [[Clostridium] polysaccharolyticum]SET19466.1 hypothetical protein SAMN04487772_11032 [[Clostridium] polysaccharolyticum]
MNQNIVWITRTSLCAALLIIAQIASVSFGSTLLTGTIVNLVLIVSVMVYGLSTGLTVAFISPVLAKIFGIGPMWILIPFIMSGNLVIILVWHFVCRKWKGGFGYIQACVGGAAAKFLVMYLGIVKVAIPLLLRLPKSKAMALSAVFFLPQLITALAGGLFAVIIVPVIKNVTKQ